MLVVSDTSPIRALAHLNRLELLRELFGEVVIPPAVVAELLAYRPRFAPIDPAGIPWVKSATPTDRSVLGELLKELHSGEAEAIALALELRASLLIDEARGREVAVRSGLHAIGTMGVLGQAKAAKLVPEVRPLIERLVAEINFFADRKLIERFLASIGE